MRNIHHLLFMSQVSPALCLLLKFNLGPKSSTNFPGTLVHNDLCFLIKINKIQLWKKKVRNFKCLEKGWPSQPKPPKEDRQHKHLNFWAQNTQKTKLKTRHPWKEYFNGWLIRGRQSKYRRKQLTNRKSQTGSHHWWGNVEWLSTFSYVEKAQGKALPYNADLHVSEYGPLERAIWHTHQNVKAFSPAVLFTIPIKAHSQVWKADRTRDTTLSVIKKKKNTVPSKTLLQLYQTFIKLGKSTFKMKAFVLCACHFTKPKL